MARCAGERTDLMFPEDRAYISSNQYKSELKYIREEFCWKCPVRVRCFEYALSTKDTNEYGVWAGTTPSNRSGFVQVRCSCGKTIDPFDLVHKLTFKCRTCKLAA